MYVDMQKSVVAKASLTASYLVQSRPVGWDRHHIGPFSSTACSIPAGLANFSHPGDKPLPFPGNMA